MISRVLSVILVSVAFLFHANAQQDTTSVLLKTYSPKKAVILSLALPGAGQVYNDEWWKVPIIYGLGAFMVNRIAVNGHYYRSFKEAYVASYDDLVHHPYEDLYSQATIKRNRDIFDKNTQLSWIGLVAVYGLNAVDAYVFAHLKGYDVSDDLSWQLQPTIKNLPQGTSALAMGMTLTIPLK